MGQRVEKEIEALEKVRKCSIFHHVKKYYKTYIALMTLVTRTPSKSLTSWNPPPCTVNHESKKNDDVVDVVYTF